MRTSLSKWLYVQASSLPLHWGQSPIFRHSRGIGLPKKSHLNRSALSQLRIGDVPRQDPGNEFRKSTRHRISERAPGSTVSHCAECPLDDGRLARVVRRLEWTTTLPKPIRSAKLLRVGLRGQIPRSETETHRLADKILPCVGWYSKRAATKAELACFT